MKLVKLVIIIIFFIFLYTLVHFSATTGFITYDKAKSIPITKDFICNKENVQTDILKYRHAESDYNSLRLCCERLGGYWFDVTKRRSRCSSIFYCSGRYDPKKPWPHCVILDR